MRLQPETARQRNVYGLNPALYKWLVTRAALQRTPTGALTNHLIYRYRDQQQASTYTPPAPYPYLPQPNNHHNIAGIDDTLWQWLKAHAKIHRVKYGQILNELIQHYHNQEPWCFGHSPYPPFNQRDAHAGTDRHPPFPVAATRPKPPPRPARSIRGVDPELGRWLKAQALSQGRTAGLLLNDIIELYWHRIGWSEANAKRVPNPHPSLTIRGLDPELWQWIKDRAIQDNKIAGDVVNDLIRHHRRETANGQPIPPVLAPLSDPDHIISVKGIDRWLWQHLKDGAALEQKTIGEALNEIIQWYRRSQDRP